MVFFAQRLEVIGDGVESERVDSIGDVFGALEWGGVEFILADVAVPGGQQRVIDGG
jgi:hypothetical protein